MPATAAGGNFEDGGVPTRGDTPLSDVTRVAPGALRSSAGDGKAER